jgi:hypothetical protein
MGPGGMSPTPLPKHDDGAWLKADGDIQRYQTREQAEAEATRLAREHDGNPHRRASFRYTVRPLPTR